MSAGIDQSEWVIGKSGRPIKKGGKAHRRMIKEAQLHGAPAAPSGAAPAPHKPMRHDLTATTNKLKAKKKASRSSLMPKKRKSVVMETPAEVHMESKEEDSSSESESEDEPLLPNGAATPRAEAETVEVDSSSEESEDDMKDVAPPEPVPAPKKQKKKKKKKKAAPAPVADPVVTKKKKKKKSKAKMAGVIEDWLAENEEKLTRAYESLGEGPQFVAYLNKLMEYDMV